MLANAERFQKLGGHFPQERLHGRVEAVGLLHRRDDAERPGTRTASRKCNGRHDADVPVITVVMAQFVTEMGLHWNLMAATAVMALAPAFLVALFGQKYVIRGLRI